MMRPVRLAVLFDEPVIAGGGYQQALNAALMLRRLPTAVVEPVFFTTVVANVASLRSHDIEAIHLPMSVLRTASLRLRRLVRHPRLLRPLREICGVNSFERSFVNHDIDLVYFLSPSGLANDLERLNYITTVFDLCHRDDPEFPEVRGDRMFEVRDDTYRSILPKAIAVLVDSPRGKANACRRYGIDPDRVSVMPFQPARATDVGQEAYDAGYIEVAAKYTLQCPYVFYPAQFWAHKNHVYLLEGLKRLEDDFGHRIGAILAGTDKGNLAHVQRVTGELGLADRVRFPGFVRDEELPYLYRQAIALVMPTYFGPTNLPPLEAFRLGVPVLYPDKAGLRDQVGDAGLLLDLHNPSSMAVHLHGLLTMPALREELARRGRERLKGPSDESRARVMEAILREFQCRRRCWA